MGATRDPVRSVDILLAGLPKAARLGREAFASQLGRMLCARDVVVMDAYALRRLDRLDTFVLDSGLAVTSGREIGDVVAIGDVSAGEVRRHVGRLVDLEPPAGSRRRGAWSVEPIPARGSGLPSVHRRAGRPGGDPAGSDGADRREEPPGPRGQRGIARRARRRGAVPGVSRFFGCTPLDPLGWGIALVAASGAALATVALPRALRRLQASL